MHRTSSSPGLHKEPSADELYFTVDNFSMALGRDGESICFMAGREELFDMAIVFDPPHPNTVEELFTYSDTDEGYNIEISVGDDAYVYIEHGHEVSKSDTWYRVPISVFRQAFANFKKRQK
ncbi:hypothetical protein QOT17_006835 [Balamuthia mandrillaris]